MKKGNFFRIKGANFEENLAYWISCGSTFIATGIVGLMFIYLELFNEITWREFSLIWIIGGFCILIICILVGYRHYNKKEGGNK